MLWTYSDVDQGGVLYGTNEGAKPPMIPKRVVKVHKATMVKGPFWLSVESRISSFQGVETV